MNLEAIILAAKLLPKLAAIVQDVQVLVLDPRFVELLKKIEAVIPDIEKLTDTLN